MTTIAVASGKGGAGKTSISAALATFLGPRCLVADCDVDAANGTIALGGTMARREDYYAGPGYRIEAEACSGCGECATVCRFGAIRNLAQAGHYEIISELCERCGACTDRCHAKAIVSYDKKAGELLVSTTRLGLTLVHAELVPGEDTSGKLVRKVREKAMALARPDMTIVVDAPPGIGCPVIASLSGCDLAVVVVEASASGIRDAERLIELLSSMKRDAIGVINKAGLDARMDSKAGDILRRAGLPLAGTIPFDPALRSVEERGQTWLDASGETGNIVRWVIEAIDGVLEAVVRKRIQVRAEEQK